MQTGVYISHTACCSTETLSANFTEPDIELIMPSIIAGIQDAHGDDVIGACYSPKQEVLLVTFKRVGQAMAFAELWPETLNEFVRCVMDEDPDLKSFHNLKSVDEKLQDKQEGV